MEINILRATTDAQFKSVAVLHQSGISEGFLSTLGLPFLATLYRGISKEANSGVMIAVDEKMKVIGFVSFTSDIRKCYENVIFNNFLSLSISITPNIFKIGIYQKVFETLSYPLGKKTSQKNMRKDSDPNIARPELLSMAVDAKTRGAGIGKKLVGMTDDWMEKIGVPGYFVVTHGLDERSNGFYENCGFRKLRIFQNHGKPMNEYYKELNQ